VCAFLFGAGFGRFSRRLRAVIGTPAGVLGRDWGNRARPDRTNAGRALESVREEPRMAKRAGKRWTQRRTATIQRRYDLRGGVFTFDASAPHRAVAEALRRHESATKTDPFRSAMSIARVLPQPCRKNSRRRAVPASKRPRTSCGRVRPAPAQRLSLRATAAAKPSGRWGPTQRSRVVFQDGDQAVVTRDPQITQDGKVEPRNTGCRRRDDGDGFAAPPPTRAGIGPLSA